MIGVIQMAKQFNDDKIAFTFRVDTTAYEKSKKIAKKELRSVNSQLEYFILKAVEQYETDNGEINLDDE